MCPCNGRGYTWHVNNNLSQCDASRRKRLKYNKKKDWVAGSPILVEEIEQL